MSRHQELILVGLSHHTAPIAIRERVAIAEGRLAEALDELKQLEAIRESLVVSTCNRVEIYAAAEGDAGAAARSLRSYLVAGDGELDRHLYERRGPAAIQHLFRVCASLDSMVLGEPQIAGQVKEAFATAEEKGTIGTLLTRSCSRAFAVAKRVRNETEVGRAAVSMSFAAVEVAAKILGSLEGKAVLLIGAGKMSTLAAKHLIRAGASRVMVVNRSPERAQELVGEIGGEAHPWESLPSRLAEADVVLCSTAATQPVVTVELALAARRARKHRPLFFVDLAVPRDVDPKVNSLDGIFVYDVDDINQVIGENLRARQEEAKRAEELVAREATAFFSALHSEAAPILRELRQRGEEVAKSEVERTLARFGDQLSSKQRQSIEALSRAIVNKLLHEPTTRLRQAGEEGEGELVTAAAALFGIEPPPSVVAPAPSGEEASRKEEAVTATSTSGQEAIAARTPGLEAGREGAEAGGRPQSQERAEREESPSIPGGPLRAAGLARG